jgi:hypothetical protein
VSNLVENYIHVLSAHSVRRLKHNQVLDSFLLETKNKMEYILQEVVKNLFKARCWLNLFNFISFRPEKETQKWKYKNPKVQKSNRCEIVKSNNRIIQKSKSWNIQKIHAAFENNICKLKILFLFIWFSWEDYLKDTLQYFPL